MPTSKRSKKMVALFTMSEQKTNMPTYQFISSHPKTLPDGQIWWPETILSIEAESHDDACEHVGHITNDQYGFAHTTAGPSPYPVAHTIKLPEDWQPCRAYLVCEKLPHVNMLIKRFRYKSREGDYPTKTAAAAKLLAVGLIERLRERQPEKYFFIADQTGMEINIR
jgi:hypothetical protein